MAGLAKCIPNSTSPLWYRMLSGLLKYLATFFSLLSVRPPNAMGRPVRSRMGNMTRPLKKSHSLPSLSLARPNARSRSGV